MKDCVFCKIINGELSSKKIYEDDDMLAFLDINPFSTGHTLIVPKVHTLDLQTIDLELLEKIINRAKVLSKDITSKLEAPGYTLIQNNGHVEEVKHFHLHIIPKYNQKKEMSLDEVYKKITENK